MAAKPTQRKGWELFAHPAQPNQRRYEALRAYLYEGASLDQAAGRFGYTPATLNSLARDLRAGKLALFAPAGKPGRKHAPKKDRALPRVIQLRRDGLSVYEISTRLAVEGIGLNRTGVGQILREEGFGRLLRDPAAGLFAGLGVLPKKTALTDYSYRLAHHQQRALLAALDAKMIASGLASSEEAIFAQDSGTHTLVYAGADISKATQAREVLAFCDHWKAVSGADPHLLILDSKVTTQPVLGELDQ